MPERRSSRDALALGPVKRLLGVNVDGWLVAGAAPSHYSRFVSDGDLAKLVSWRLPHVRLPVDGALTAAEGWRALDDAIGRCLRQSLTVTLALRLDDHGALFASPDGWRATAEWWRAVAARYRDSGVRFDLLDEPQPPASVSEEALSALGSPRLSAAAARRAPLPGAVEGRAWSALAGRLTAAIREVAPDAPLVVQPAGGVPEAFAHLRPTRDARTGYGFHAFSPQALTRRGEGTYPGEVAGERWDRERLRATLEPALAFGRAHEAPVEVVAFGITRAAPRQSRLTWTRSLLSLCRSEGMGWCYWTLRHPEFGLVVEAGVDYDLLGVLQSE
ncbi:MAG TPA: cellulase family glycosylhydrolase [Chloroflexota bacterium]|nr:cellulase family glycosylhydrolase [Chloroflexota bacterium]